MFRYTFICQSALVGLAFFMFSCHKKSENNKRITEKETELLPLPVYGDTLNSLKERNLREYVQAAGTVKPNTKNGIPFDRLDYDRIIAYEFEGDEEVYDNIIDEKGKFVPVIQKQQFLTQEQAHDILSALAKNSSYGESSAACFQPNLGLVFFKGNKKINQISICLSCNSSITEIDIPARTHRVFNKGTDNGYSLIGFTTSGKAAIIDLCKKINFHYGNKKE